MKNANQYSFIKLNDLYSQPLEIDWIIEDLIPNNSVGMIYGASSTGKSHIILSMAAMIANGLPWFGKETKQGNVLVMVGEGLTGISKRLQAIEKEHDLTIDQSKLFVSNRAIGLDTDTGYKNVEDAIEGLDEPPQLIIIDTLSRHIDNSEENSNRDMAKFLGRLEELRFKYGCTIILVHHTGKGEGQGARGASALLANVDFCFSVASERKLSSLSCKKMKDADDSIPNMYFEIKGVDLGGVSSKGKPITGACVVSSEASLSSLAPSQSKADLALACFDPDKKKWQQAYIDSCTDSIDEESMKRQFRDARKILVDTNVVSVNDDGSYSLNQAA